MAEQRVLRPEVIPRFEIHSRAAGIGLDGTPLDITFENPTDTLDVRNGGDVLIESRHGGMFFADDGETIDPIRSGGFSRTLSAPAAESMAEFFSTAGSAESMHHMTEAEAVDVGLRAMARADAAVGQAKRNLVDEAMARLAQPDDEPDDVAKRRALVKAEVDPLSTTVAGIQFFRGKPEEPKNADRLRVDPDAPRATGKNYALIMAAGDVTILRIRGDRITQLTSEQRQRDENGVPTGPLTNALSGNGRPTLADLDRGANPTIEMQTKLDQVYVTETNAGDRYIILSNGATGSGHPSNSRISPREILKANRDSHTDDLADRIAALPRQLERARYQYPGKRAAQPAHGEPRDDDYRPATPADPEFMAPTRGNGDTLTVGILDVMAEIEEAAQGHHEHHRRASLTRRIVTGLGVAAFAGADLVGLKLAVDAFADGDEKVATGGYITLVGLLAVAGAGYRAITGVHRRLVDREHRRNMGASYREHH